MWFLLACTSPPPSDAARADKEPKAEHLPGETGEAPDEPPLDVPEEADWIFDPTAIHDIDLSLSDAAIQALRQDAYTFTRGDFTIDGVVVPDVGVRLRGKIGSFRTLSGKPKFKIDFGEFVDGQSVSGLKSLALNNEVVDCSYLKEPVGYEVFRQLGVPASRIGFSRVTVNGEPYGLYVLVEVPDKRLLEDHYEEPDGNLYDGKYAYYEDGSYELIDFVEGMDHLFQLEEGEDVALADIRTITNALVDASSAGFTAAAAPLLDMDRIHTYWAGEQWIGHVDGYALNRNNYRVYFDPEDGRAEFLPWDFDYAFYEDYSWGYSWASPNGRMAQACWREEACHAEQAAAVDAATTTIDAVAIGEQLDAWIALIEDDAMDDPRRECGRSSVRSEQDALKAWVAGRSASVRASWGL